MIPTGRHIDLSDTSAPPRALLTTIEVATTKMRAGWRGAIWRQLSCMRGVKETAGGGWGTGTWDTDSIASESRGQVEFVDIPMVGGVVIPIPAYTGDRILGFRVGARGSTIETAVPITLQMDLIRGVSFPDDGQPVRSLAKETIVTASMSLEQETIVDAFLDVEAALNGVPPVVSRWHFYRMRVVATSSQAISTSGLSRIRFFSASALVDHHPVP